MASTITPSQSEGDVNHTPRRTQWQREQMDDALDIPEQCLAAVA